MCSSFMVSIALTMASCSAWLFEQMLWSVSLLFCASLFCMNMAIPAPTPCALLLPSVNIWMASSTWCSVILTVSAGCSQSSGCASLSMFWGQFVVLVSWSFSLLFLLMIWKSCAASSSLMSIGVRPLIVHSASFETVRKDFPILLLISLWTLMSFIL